jgi:hypothetical protein
MAAMDWGTVVSAGITGVVGLAGIGGSIASARLAGKSAAANLQMNIRAEDARTRRTEKRLIYASYLAALTQYRNAAMANLTGGRTGAEGDEERRKWDAAAWIAVQEIELVGPPNVVLAAHGVSVHIAASGEIYGRELAQLVQAMRDDLDETAGPKL